jgi:hypothetical protein
MEITEKSTLQHTVLYAKHWYKRGQDIWKDIKICLGKDGYSGYPLMSNGDCINILLRQLQRVDNKRVYELTNVLFAIQVSNCWKYGYYTNNHTWVKGYKTLPNYEINEAIVKYCLSVFQDLDKNQWEVCPPDYENCLPRRNGIKDKTIKEMFI